MAEHWVNAHLWRGRQELQAKQFAAALDDFQAAKNIPENLPKGRGDGLHGVEITYWIGMAHEGLKDGESAKQAWQEAVNWTDQSNRPRMEGRISDRQVQTCFQALAKRKLGQATDAEQTLHDLLQTADRSLAVTDEPASTAESSGSRLSPRAHAALAHYVAGLAHLGLGEVDPARTEFELALKSAPDSLGPHGELSLLPPSANR